MDQHAADADAPEQQHVLGEGAVELGVDRGAAELHDDRLAGEALDIGERLDEDPGGFGGIGHDVFEFSLI
jgi:hypothetical protein